MTDDEVLREVRVKLSDPANWYQGGWFSGVEWTQGSVANSAAAKTDCPACLMAWVARVAEQEPWRLSVTYKIDIQQYCRIEKRLQRAMEELFFEPDLDVVVTDITDWNDMGSTQHADVLRVLDRALGM